MREAWKEEVKAGKFIDAVDGNQVMHVNGREDLLEYPANGGQVDKLMTKKQLDELREEFKMGAGPYENHHVTPKWVSERLDIPENEWDNCPGLIMPENPRQAYFNPTEYQEKWQQAPIYHRGTLEEGGLEARLTQIRGEYPNPRNLTSQQMNQMLIKLKQLYMSEPYGQLNLWPPTRDWLKKHINPTLLPD